MKNLYKLLNVSEKASNEEIVASYKNIVKTETDENKKNQLRVAIDILLNEEKRKKYDSDLNKSMAEQLLKQVQVSNQIQEENKQSKIDDSPVKKIERNDIDNTRILEKEAQKKIDEIQKQVKQFNKRDDLKPNSSNKLQGTKKEEFLKREEQKKIELEKRKIAEEEIKAQELKFQKIKEEEYKKAVKKQEKIDKKNIKKAERDYKEAYAEAYHAELKKMGYNVKAPWTRRRVKSLIISLLVLIVFIFILSRIPFVKEGLEELYNSNYIIKSVVDIFKTIFDGIKKTIEQI